jgi:hypothetical protein
MNLSSLSSSEDNIRSLLSNHVRRDSSECSRDTREDGSINDTQTLSSTNIEATVKNSHLVVISTNGAGGRGVVAPCAVTDVVGQLLGGLDVRAGKDLGDGDELALECVASQGDGLLHSGDILLPVTNTGVEVVVGDGRDVERVSGLQGDGTGVVAGVSLEDGPGEEVVDGGGVDAVVGEVAAEVDRATEGEDVPVVVLGDAGLVEHVGTETGGSVETAVAKDGGVVALDAGVGRVTLEGATVQSREIVLDCALDGDLVVVLEVGTDTGKVDNDGDVELLQLIGRTNTRELEKLGRVVCTTGNDDLTRGLNGTSSSLSASVLRAGLVEVLTLEEVNASGSGAVEVDLCDVGVKLNIERVHLGAVVEFGVADGDNELTRTSALAISGADGDLEQTWILVTSEGVGVSIAGKEGGKVDNSVGLVAKSERSTADQTQELRVAGDDIDGGVLGAQPSLVAVALTSGEVGVLLELDKVLAHVVRSPRVVTSKILDVLEVRSMRVDSDQSVVSCAATKGASARVQGSLLDGASGRRQTSVQSTIWCLVRGLEVLGLPVLVGVVLDEEVPGQVGVLRDLRVERRYSVVLIGTLVITSFDQKGLVASHGKAGSERATTCKTCQPRSLSWPLRCSTHQHHFQRRHIRIP